MDQLIYEKIRETAAAEPDRLFAVDESGRTSYAEAAALIARGAGKLLAAGCAAGEKVLVRCTQDRFFLLAGFAVQAAGAVFVPLEKNLTAGRCAEIAADTGAKRLISGEEEQVGDLSCIRMEELFAGPETEGGESALPEIRPEAVAELLYTTGTTGASKGIEITHKNNTALAENIISGTEMKPGNVEWIPLPLSHSHGLRTCYANLYLGGTVLLTDGVSKVKWIIELLVTCGATAMDLSPTAAAVLLKLTRGRIAELGPQLDYIEIGTAALPEELKETLVRTFPDTRLYNFYGSTESGRSCALNFNSEDDEKYCIGYPTKHARFFVTDAERREIRSFAEHTGLLACAGPMNMKGYYCQEALTREVLRDGVLYTSDEGYIDGKGRVFCLGRMGDVINYRGIKIAPEEIEEKAAHFPGILDCACVGLPDDTRGEIPVLAYMTKRAELDEAALVTFLAEALEKERLPKRVVRVESIPRTVNGKLRRGELKEALRGHA